MIPRRFLLGALMMVLLAGLATLGWSSSTSDTNAKISSRVLSDTTNGASTEALVVLTEQANLSPAYSLKTKSEKGTSYSTRCAALPTARKARSSAF